MPAAPLQRYHQKRDFGLTPEPKGRKARDDHEEREAPAPTRRSTPSKKHPRALPSKRGADSRSSTFPAHVELQLATLVDAVPVGDDWVHEIKLDGYRLMAKVRSGQVSLVTRGEQDWTARYPRVVEGLEGIDVKTAIFDGEVVVLDERGVSDFQLLQNAMSNSHQPTQYFIFDLLHLDGHDLLHLPLLDRKKRLQDILGGSSRSKGAVHYCDHVVGRGEAFFAQACELGLEGVVSKRGDRPHVAGRTRDWLKTKCSQQQEFVIGGYTDPAGSRQNLGALLLGVNEGGRLAYTGKVGTGFTEQSLAQIRKRLDAVAERESPFDDVPRADMRGVHWVKPELVAEIRFTGFTHDGLLRHPTFRGLRDDKSPHDVTRERAVPRRVAVEASSKGSRPPRASKRGPASSAVAKSSVTNGITHPDRVLYPEQGITKAELDQYFADVAPRILPHVAGRPLMLMRCPEGTQKSCFIQKHMAAGMGDAVRSVSIRQKSGVRAHMVIDDAEGLRALVQFGTLEVHVWGALAADVEHPDRLVFDLDPGPDVDFKRVREGALQIRTRLSKLGLESFPKTTGGRGLHVVVPIQATTGWDEAKEFCKQLAVAVANDDPEHFVATSSKAQRRGKIYIDYLRNARGATAVAAYSPRARSGAPVSTPIAWDELTPSLSPESFTVRSLAKRLAKSKDDPWPGFFDVRQALP